MAAQASKFPPVANGASGFVQRHVLPVVGVDEVRRVVGGLQGSPFFVAERATEGWIDLVVTNETIRHLRKIVLGERRRLLHAAVTSGAGARAVEMPADIAGR